MQKIAIIGAGPAGIYLSLFLRNFPGKVVLFEKNERIGKKLSITGGGRMNLGNVNFGVSAFVSTEKNILKNIFKSPHSRKIESLFEGFETKFRIEGDRILLKSENAVQEVRRLKSLLEQQTNLELRIGKNVKNLIINSGKYEIEGERFDAVVITSGSQVALGHSPSRQDAYALPLELGHALTSLEAALCSLEIEDSPFANLKGLALECQIKNCKTKETERGDLLFTHQGISGPVVLDFTRFELNTEIELNFLPEMKRIEFEDIISTNRKSKKLLKNLLSQHLPKRFVEWILLISGIASSQAIASLNKKQEEKLLENLFAFRVKSPQKTPPTQAWTMRGGVSLREINPATLESKLHPNLYLGGEVLDVTGKCGGYNISFAMLSARLIAEAILKKETNRLR